jgi:hypothetical protein
MTLGTGVDAKTYSRAGGAGEGPAILGTWIAAKTALPEGGE